MWPSWIGRHSLPCGRHGCVLWVAVIDVAVMVCGRHGIGLSRRPRSSSGCGMGLEQPAICSWRRRHQVDLSSAIKDTSLSAHFYRWL